ncbi:MAG TPA: DUF805 domain-containing protein [Bradyrhizobium sp.]|nr:DUF805 domain-containing protein [Bradyrhizobium sp.]
MAERGTLPTEHYGMNWTWYLFGFQGRINRAKCWLAGPIMLALLAVFLTLIHLCLTIDFVANAMTTAYGKGEVSLRLGLDDVYSVFDTAAWRALSLGILPVVLAKAAGIVLVLWIFLATSVKRLHDRDRSGWWIVPFFSLPNLYNHYSDPLPDSYFMLIPSLILFVLMIWGFVELYFLRGSRKTNRFGPNPLAPVRTEKRWEQHREIETVPHKAGPPPVWRVKPGV